MSAAPHHPVSALQPCVGVLLLDTRFPRPPGDIGNPATFAALSLPVRYRVVRGASPDGVVRRSAALDLAPFVAAAEALVAQGATLLATSCGFLARHQPALQAALPVPMLSSALLWLADPALDAAHTGVLTIDAASLDADQLAGAGARAGAPVQGVAPGCEFQRRILGNETTLDTVAASQNVVAAAQALCARRPDLSTLVLECTNMPPYADAVRAATGRRVEHLVSLIAQRWKLLA